MAVDGEIIRPKAMTSGSICGSGDGTALLVGYKENSGICISVIPVDIRTNGVIEFHFI